MHLKSRCHGFPLESLSHDITPTGLHYLLIHYDVPHIDPATYVLKIHGAVQRPVSWDLATIKSRPAQSRAVTMECGGAGRVHQKYRLWQHVPWVSQRERERGNRQQRKAYGLGMRVCGLHVH